MRASFTPSAGFRVYCVTEGPTFTSDISTSIPKFCSVLFIMLALAFMSPDEGVPLSSSKRSGGGGSYLNSEARSVLEGFFGGVKKVLCKKDCGGSSAFSSPLSGPPASEAGKTLGVFWASTPSVGEESGSTIGSFSSRFANSPPALRNLNGMLSITRSDAATKAEKITSAAQKSNNFKSG